MRSTFVLAVVALSAFVGGTVRADGLIYQLPEDGSWVQYELQAQTPSRDGNGRKAMNLSGKVTISCVGVETVEGVPCRWIEVVLEADRNGRTFTEIDKVLIPEKHIGRGKRPKPHVVALWHMHSSYNGGAPRKIQSVDERFQIGRPLHLVLHPPFANEKKLDKKMVDGNLGRLECEGVSAREMVKHERSNIEHQSSYEIRLHQSAPFGVVAWKATYVTSREGSVLNTWTLTGTLCGAGQNAKSKLTVEG